MLASQWTPFVESVVCSVTQCPQLQFPSQCDPEMSASRRARNRRSSARLSGDAVCDGRPAYRPAGRPEDRTAGRPLSDRPGRRTVQISASKHRRRDMLAWPASPRARKHAVADAGHDGEAAGQKSARPPPSSPRWPRRRPPLGRHVALEQRPLFLGRFAALGPVAALGRCAFIAHGRGGCWPRSRSDRAAWLRRSASSRDAGSSGAR